MWADQANASKMIVFMDALVKCLCVSLLKGFPLLQSVWCIALGHTDEPIWMHEVRHSPFIE